MSAASKRVHRVAHKTQPFSQLGNALLQDRRLSLDARGFLCSVLSRPPTWRFTLTWMQAEHKIGRERARRLIAECTAAGYVQRQRIRDARGRLGRADYVFADDLQYLQTVYPSVGDDENLMTGHPTVGSPGTGETPPIEKKYSQKKSDSTSVPNNIHTTYKQAAESKSAVAGTDERLPFTPGVIEQISALGVDGENLIETYVRKTRDKCIVDPSAYLLRMAQDEVAKRCGVSADDVRRSTAKNRRERIDAAVDATGAFNTPSATVIAAVRPPIDKHVPAILTLLSRRQFKSQAACDDAFRMEIGNARWRPPTGTMVAKTALITGSAA